MTDDNSIRIASPVGPTTGRQPARALVPASGDEQPELERAPQKLMVGLVSYLAAQGIGYTLASSGEELVIGFRDDDKRYIYFATTPGLMHVFYPVGPVVPAGEGEAAIAAYLDGLTATVPVPRVFDGVARYEMNDERELGLYVTLAMPRTFSAPAVADALWLIDWLSRQLEKRSR